MTKEQVSDAIESVGSAMANTSLIVMASQAAWPVPGFILPQGLVMFAFYMSIAGMFTRSMSKSVANFIFLFFETKTATVKTETIAEEKKP